MSDDHRLSKVQRNQIAELATAVGLDLSEFRWSEQIEDGTPFSVLEHVPTKARIAFGPGSQYAYWLTWWPNFDGGQPYSSANSWQDALSHTRAWLTAVIDEHDAADLWAAALQERAWLTEVPSASGNEPFSANEREVIARHLQTIESYAVKTYALDASQQAEIKAQFDYLRNATERLGRFDWRGLAASTFIGIVLQLGLTPDRASGLMNLATQLLGPLVSGAARLLGG